MHYLERVAAELHELLERYDSEAFAAQAALDADRKGAARHIKSLQEEVTRLQERAAARATLAALCDGFAGAAIAARVLPCLPCMHPPPIWTRLCGQIREASQAYVGLPRRLDSSVVSAAATDKHITRAQGVTSSGHVQIQEIRK